MTDERMREKLSALADNELDELEERQVFVALKSDPDLRNTWERYHLVRSALRQELDVVVTRAAAEKATQRIDAESFQPVPFMRRRLVRLAGTLAIAASVAVIAITGAQWMQQPDASAPPTLAANNPPTELIRSGTTRWDVKEPEMENALNAYLVGHDEFASTSGLGGMMPYVRVVTYDNVK